MVAKVAGGIIGLGLIGTGSVAMAKPEWFGINKEVLWTPLSKDHSFSTNETSNYGTTKFGGKYKGVLTGIVGTKSGENTNEGWWKKAFEQLKIDSKVSGSSVGEKFKYVSDTNGPITTAVSNDSSGKGLNQICNEVYKASTTNIASTEDGNNYKEADVWKYCSPIGSKPTTVSEDNPNNTPSGSIGKDTTNNQKLVSITGNDKFWELRDKEFKGIGKYQKIEETKDDFFDLGKNKTIKELCGEAYTKTAVSSGDSTADAPTLAKALKYCSINKE